MIELNKHILLTMKWLDDKNSVGRCELLENREAATAAATAAYVAGGTAAGDAADAEEWVEEYFKKSGENKQDYLDTIEEEKVSSKKEPTQEWVDGLPPIGCECEVFISLGVLQGDHGLSSEEIGLNGQKVTVIANVKSSLGYNVSVFEVESFGVYCFGSELLKPIKTQEQKDREAFIEKGLESYDNCEAKLFVDYVKLLLGRMFDDGFKAPEGE